MPLQLDLERERLRVSTEKLIGEVEFLQDNPPKLVEYSSENLFPEKL